MVVYTGSKINFFASVCKGDKPEISFGSYMRVIM